MRIAPVYFFSEDISFKLSGKKILKSWVSSIIQNEGFGLESLCFIFCSDRYLLKINREYLNHDFLTDVITFGHSEKKRMVHGDIFISLPRVKENARLFGCPVKDELHRVMIHGVLHLLGYSDKTTLQKKRIKKKEDQALLLLRKL